MNGWLATVDPILAGMSSGACALGRSSTRSVQKPCGCQTESFRLLLQLKVQAQVLAQSQWGSSKPSV